MSCLLVSSRLSQQLFTQLIRQSCLTKLPFTSESTQAAIFPWEHTTEVPWIQNWTFCLQDLYLNLYCQSFINTLKYSQKMKFSRELDLRSLRWEIRVLPVRSRRGKTSKPLVELSKVVIQNRIAVLS